ncbi:RIP metalloprotease RseP [Acidithiobacillus sulfuriphilus]|uniref:RIP metalloprotease RseP n=1 Tax=Acidithiobacillus sulfuriphilus TaxID=1867749 RepID=UPI003F6445DF
MQILGTVLAFVVAIGILVLVHESGHFGMAKWMGVKVLRFSIGFGPALITRRFGKDRTEYVIAALPLGGYVKMLGEEGGEAVAAEDRPRAFDALPPGKRFLIALAGPAANLLFAVVAYAGVAWLGIPGLAPIIGDVRPDSLAAQAGLVPGERVAAVAGQRVHSWEDLRLDLIGAAMGRSATRIDIISAAGGRQSHWLPFGELPADAIGPAFLSHGVGIEPYLPVRVGAVQPGSPAQRAGLQAGDRILAANGQRIGTWETFLRLVEAHPGQALLLQVATVSGRTRALTVIPEGVRNAQGKTVGRIGIALAPVPKDLIVIHHRGFLSGLVYGAERTWQMSAMTAEMMLRMVQGFISPDNISGPITIAEFAGQSAQAGLAPFLAFLGLVSISLGILNLLPIPILDGGHLFFYTLEMIRGVPLSTSVMQKSQQIGIVLLMMLMSLAFYNDIMRLLTP